MSHIEKKDFLNALAVAENDIGKPNSLLATITLVSDVKQETAQLLEEYLVQVSWHPDTRVFEVISQEVRQGKTILVSQVFHWDGVMWRFSDLEEKSTVNTLWGGYQKV